MRGKKILLPFIPVVSLVVYGLVPLSSSIWDVPTNSTLLENKHHYLSNLSLGDSVSRPNVVFILADDLGKMDISTYGGSNLETPEIDKLAAEGVLFTEGYTTNPICSPSRAGLLTGRNQSRFGYENNIHERYPKNRLEKFIYKYFMATDQWQVADVSSYPSEEEMVKQGIPAEEILISELLHRVGYRTGILGKWHLGYNDMAIPINRGFDYQYGFYEAFSLYQPTDHENVINQQGTDFSDPFIWEKGRSGTCAIRKNHVEIQEEGYLTDRIADEAEAFIETNRDTSFFLYVSFNAPHTPFQAQKGYYDMYAHIKDPYKRIYYAMIKNLDDAVGRINSRLKKHGLEENTLVVFMSDNGAALYTNTGDNAPLKGGKMTHFQGGINVPFMMKWTGVIPEGSTYDEPVITTDLFSTITSRLNVELPKDRTYDGIDLIAQMTKETVERDLFWRSDYLRSIRSGDWKYSEDRLGGEKVLYNLKDDPYERVNLVEERSDQMIILIDKLDQWEKECENPRWPRVMDFKFTTEGKDFYFPL